MASPSTLEIRIDDRRNALKSTGRYAFPEHLRGKRVVKISTHPRLAKLFRVDPPRKPYPKRPKRVPHRPIPTNPLTGLLSVPRVVAAARDPELVVREEHLDRIARSKRKRIRRARKAA